MTKITKAIELKIAIYFKKFKFGTIFVHKIYNNYYLKSLPIICIYPTLTILISPHTIFLIITSSLITKKVTFNLK